MRKTEIPRLFVANCARASFLVLGASFALLPPCSPAQEPAPPIETTQSRFIQPNDVALWRWLNERERQTGAAIRLQPLEHRAGDGSELFRQLWAQRMFDRLAELHGPERARELIDWVAMIVNGTPSTGLQAVGAVLKVGDDGGFEGLECSGTLVGPSHFLTAAHCASESTGNFRVYLQHEGILPIASRMTFCQTPDCDSYTNDLAMLELEVAVLTVQPMPVTAAVTSLLNASTYQIAGFGVFLTSHDGEWELDYGGIKHRAEGINGADCPEGEDPARTICYPSFPVDAGKPAACNRDSGGPVLPASADSASILGVLRHGAPACQDGFIKNVRLAHASYQEWLTEHFQLPDPGIPSHAVIEELSVEDGEFLVNSTPSLHTIQVDEDADLLLITLNHEVYVTKLPSNAFGLELRNPQGILQCAAAVGPFAECRVESPEPGEWRIEVNPNNGQGLFQVTAQVLKEAQPTAPKPPEPPVVQ